MKVLVAYASKYGSTKGIAESIGEKLRQHGMQVDVLEVDGVRNAEDFDAFVIGSAVYMFHWMKEAKQFVSKNRAVLANRPVWLFSSGSTGTKTTDPKGRDLLEVSGPKELDELRELVNPRDHRVFFGALYRDRLKGTAGLFARWIPREGEGDFRDWKRIEEWAVSIAQALTEMETGRQ